MKLRISGLLGIAAFAAICILASAQGPAQNAYITNFDDHTVSVNDTATNSIIADVQIENAREARK